MGPEASGYSPSAIAMLATGLSRRGFAGRRLLRPGTLPGRFRHGGAAFENGVGDSSQNQLDRANTVVVAGNRQIDRVRIAVGIDQGHVVTPMRWASLTAMCSRCGSMTTRARATGSCRGCPSRLR